MLSLTSSIICCPVFSIEPLGVVAFGDCADEGVVVFIEEGRVLDLDNFVGCKGWCPDGEAEDDLSALAEFVG